ncbi:carbohydrate ABC transporter membrane protein 1, CUT1 family [Seinonella peptonophila]|uniref:Carbohydrate ABC transporter membrane protein 1, CUT1 family n=1 Tax=Seinonella peptonophila TaxID=112248 RepID=A0A1M4T484_9BACL|nr:sugar ABC transporter permease [Seinonella peptonophila]SHE39279.1 carbohydrate ABC transporter membrane protein 1, CUT1 family [Seinonella peptonophila]
MVSNLFSQQKRDERITAYGFLLPNMIGLAVFVFLPILYSFYVSLHDWNLLSSKVFVGFDNYIKLAQDKQWWQSLLKTLQFSLLYVPSLFICSLFLAVILHSITGRIKNVIQTLYLLPFAISSIIAAVIWMFFYDPRNGFLNQMLSAIGMEQQQFLGSTSQAMLCVVVVMLWMNVGYNMIIFLGAIKDIPADYYEASRIEGANRWQTFIHITFPLLRETSTFIFIVNIIGSFQVFDIIQVMTKGGPSSATEVSVLYIFEEAFKQLNMGYASALAFVLFLIIFIFSTIFLRKFSSN